MCVPYLSITSLDPEACDMPSAEGTHLMLTKEEIRIIDLEETVQRVEWTGFYWVSLCIRSLKYVPTFPCLSCSGVKRALLILQKDC